MKAVQIKAYGSNDVVQIIEVPAPKPQAGEVLLKVIAAGVNPIDWKIRNGAGERIGLKLPIHLGGEIAGRVESLGSGVNNFKVGDLVYGMVKTGGFAEFAAAQVTDVALMPKALDFERAASLPIGGLTAWQALFDLAKLKDGQRILITGASGAVGSLAVQFAKQKGAWVAGTASGKNRDFLLSLSLDQFIDYEKENFEERLRDLDVVFDTVGGSVFEKCSLVLKDGGALVTSVAFPKGEEAQRVYCKPNQGQLNQISEMFGRGELQVRISKILPLAQVREALALSESGQANGKIVLRIGDE